MEYYLLMFFFYSFKITKINPSDNLVIKIVGINFFCINYILQYMIKSTFTIESQTKTCSFAPLN